jgi:hypothetical protein
MAYTRRYTPFAVSSSTSVSNPLFTGDFTLLSVTVESASALTLDGSNADGLTSALASRDWSTLSVIAGAGTFSITPGVRWMRLQRSQSTQTIHLHALAGYGGSQ